jgi:hypothetical protein
VDESTARRFWAKVERGDGCWTWTASRYTANGYGQFFVAWVNGATVTTTAHRVSWELTHGPIPDGSWVLHRCDNRSCVRPDHLFLGDHDANMADMARKGRSGRAKLTAAKVAEVRRRLAVGEKHRTIAADFGVSRSAVTRINSGRIWRHV